LHAIGMRAVRKRLTESVSVTDALVEMFFDSSVFARAGSINATAIKKNGNKRTAARMREIVAAD